MKPLPRSSSRCWSTASAHGMMSPGARSAAMLRAYFGERRFHKPEKSGFPSAVRGAGADRFGLPSAVLGIALVGSFSHRSEERRVGKECRSRRCAHHEEDKYSEAA